MSREIRFGSKADRFLQDADQRIVKRIARKIEALAKNPFPRGAKKVLGEEGVFRTRVGDYRILFSLENDDRTLLIVNIDKRSRVYKR
ncbi:MAG: type II toxin-antitoxin system RelE/ParE family toxin [Methanoregula sp.]|nr:MAG: type II toxin-antitoxin system RelE/ParE family toxin [Methanoregula sp.]